MNHFLTLSIVFDDVSILIPFKGAVISFVKNLFLLFILFVPKNSDAIRVIFAESFWEKVSDSKKVDQWQLLIQTLII